MQMHRFDMNVYLNGEWTDEQQARVSPFDRGFLFGDGIYDPIENQTWGEKFDGSERAIGRPDENGEELKVPYSYIPGEKFKFFNENNAMTLQNDISKQVDDAKQPLIAAGAVAGVVILIIFYWLGRRSGRRKNTLVQIRRV